MPRTYSVTDECDNQILVIQEILIFATYHPNDAGPDQFIYLSESYVLTAINPIGVPISCDNGVTDGDMVTPLVTTTYEVTADNLGCISTDDMTLTIENPSVVSFFDDYLSEFDPLTVTFTNTSTTSIILVDCVWDIEGEPSINTCGNFVYSFNEGGSYDITLTTTSEN